MRTPLFHHLIPVRRRMFLILFLVFGCLMTVRPGLGWMDAKKQPSQPIKEKPQTPSPAGVVGVPAGPATNLTTQPNFTIVNSPAELIAAMNNPAVDAIYLYQPGSTYTLTARDNGINGHNGLPNVTRTLSIYGFGCTIERAANAPTFRAFHVTGAGNPNFPGADGRLYLYNVRLRGFTAKGGNGGDGYEPGGAGAGLGGAIFNYGGTVELRNCTLDSNLAQGGNGGNGLSNICWGGGGGLGGNGGNGFHDSFPTTGAIDTAGGGGGSGGNGGSGRTGSGGGGGQGPNAHGGDGGRLVGSNNDTASGGGGGGSLQPGGFGGNGGAGAPDGGGNGSSPGPDGNGTYYDEGRGGGGGTILSPGQNAETRFGGPGFAGRGGFNGGGGGCGGPGFHAKTGGIGGFGGGGGGGGDGDGGFGGGGGGGFSQTGGFGGGGGTDAANPFATTNAGFGAGAQGGGGGGMGGAVFCYGGRLVAIASTFSNNSALGGNGNYFRSSGGSGIGGAVSVLGVGSTTVEFYQSTIYGNTTNVGNSPGAVPTNRRGGGGGIAYISTTVNDPIRGVVEGCTVTANQALGGYKGGGMEVLSLFNDLSAVTDIKVRSSIVAGATQTKPDIFQVFNNGALNTSSYNLIGTVENSPTFVNNQNNDQVGVLDPKLLALASNGGPTQTCQLAVGSTALNRGDSTIVRDYDQREAPYNRRCGQCDVGAYEQQAPFFTTQPVSQTVCPGTSVTFTVAVDMVSTTFQWRKDGVNIAGATGSSYTINPVTAGNAGNFDCVATACTGTTSTAATLTVNGPPAVDAQPNGAILCVGNQVFLNPAFSSSTPLTYQWRKNGVNIPGATSLSYQIVSATLADIGSYDCVATNTCGFIITQPATVSVRSGPGISLHPVNQSVCEGGSNAVFTVLGSPVVPNPPLTYQWRQNGTNLPGATSTSVSIPANFSSNGAVIDCLVSDGCGATTSNPATLTVNALPTFTAHPTNQSTCTNRAVTFSITATGAASFQWRKDGTDIPGATGTSFTIPAATSADFGTYTCQATSAAGCSRISNGATLALDPPFVFTSQPGDQTVCQGTSVSFSVTVTGPSSISYQWRKGSSNIPGATSATYTIPATVPGDAGLYTCLVSSSCGAIVSNFAFLTISPLPVLRTNPVSQSICSGSPVTFHAFADTAINLNYQWRRNGINLTGPSSTSQFFTIPVVNGSHTGNYDCVITGACGSVTSTAATLTVLTAPGFSFQPVSRSICLGGSAMFSVTAVGTPAPTYQWRKNGTDIPGETSSTLTIAVITAGDGAGYSCVATNSCGSLASATGNLTVLTTPVITGQPANQNSCQGGSAFFSVTSPNAVSYQWFKAGGSTVLATTAELTLTNVDPSQGGDYFCRVTNTCGTLDSNPATLSVATVTITKQPIPQSACDGTPVTLTVEATGAVAYQWWSFNGPIGGATRPTLSVTSQNLYHCVLTGTNGCTTITNQAFVYFQYPLQLNQPLENRILCEGSEYNSVSLDLVSYDPDATFQWRKNGVNVTTAIDTGVPWEFYFPLPTTMADAGVYDCVMTNQCGPVTTNPFTVTVVTSAILTQPAVSQTVCVGGTATFTANATNYGNVFWLKTFGPGGNGGFLVGNQPTLTISNVTAANAGYYVGYFVNDCSSVRTEVILDVVPSLPPVTAASNTPAPGGTLNLTATPGTAGYFSYSWSGPNGFTSTQQNPTIPNVTTAHSGTYTVTMNGGSCSVQGTVKVAVQANTLVNLDNPTTSYTGGIAPINPSDPTFGTFTINTVLRNLSATETLQGPLYFKVTELGKTPAVPGDPRPYWLDSRNTGTPFAAGALQDIPGPVPPGGSVPVSFRIAVDQTGRSFFRFLVDVYGATNASPRTEAKLGSFNLSLGSPGSLGSLGSLKPGTRFFDFDSQDSPDSLDSPDSSFIGGAGLQSGSEMAVDPNQSRRMAVVANNYAAGTVVVKYTEDGGASWREFPLNRTVGSVTYQAAFDPSVAYDGNGNLLVTYVATNLTDNAAALVICQKLLDRLTFSPPVALVTHASAEKTALGRTSLGINKSQIAVAWESRTNGGPARINLMMLLSRRTRVVAEGNVSHPSVTVDAGGRAYVGWNDWATSRLLTVSTQDGLEYTAPVQIAATGIGYGRAIAAQADVLTTPGLTLRADPSRNGTLYAAYAGSGDGLDVWLVKSTNGGQSWTPPRRLNDDSGNADQFGPGLAVDGNGNVAVSFYDTRLNTSNETVNVYVVRSLDGGQTFGAGLRVTEVASNLSLTNPLRVRAVNFGERMGIGFSAKTDLKLVWTDNRNGNPDLFFTTER